MRFRSSLAGLVFAILFLFLPGLAHGQEWLYNDDGGDGCGFASGWPTAGFIWAEKFYPPYRTTRIDSVKFYVYRYSGATATLTFKIHLYEDNATLPSDSCPGGSVTCDAIGTERWVSANLVTPTLTLNAPRWCAFDVPDCTFFGDFVVGIEIAQPENEPSLLMDCQPGPECCYNFYRYQDAWREHWDFWNGPDDVGYNMIRALVTSLPPPPDSLLQLSTHDKWFGYADITYNGGIEVIDGYVGFWNPGNRPLTITSVTTTAPLNFVFDAGEVLGILYPWQWKWLCIDLVITTPETLITTGDLIVTHTGNNGPTDTCRMSGQGFGGHWLENFVPYPEPYPGPASSGIWYVMQNACTTSGENPGWGVYPDNHWPGSTNQCAFHYMTDEGCYAIDMLFSSSVANPNHSGVKVEWRNFNHYNSWYSFHGLYWTSPNDTVFHFVAEIPPTWDAHWVDVGPYLVLCDSDSVQLGFLYVGEFTDYWGVDEIRMDTLQGAPDDVTIHYDESTIRLQWTGTRAPFYNIYRSVTEPFADFILLATISDTFYFDTMTAETTAFYHVTSFFGGEALAPLISASGQERDVEVIPKRALVHRMNGGDILSDGTYRPTPSPARGIRPQRPLKVNEKR